MADPQSGDIGYYLVPRGGDVGTWDSPTNANWSASDSLFSNVATLSLSSTPVTLTTPPNSGAAWAGPYQSQSSFLKFTGTLTTAIAVTIPRPGFYIVQNLCLDQNGFPAGSSPGSFYVLLSTGIGGSKFIGLPPGKKMHVFSDGTDMDFVNMPDVGTAYDLHGATALPSWMVACSVQPYLIKDGTVYNNSQYPTLAGTLRNAFGGTPGLSFAVPDELARARIGYDTVGTGRLTTAGSGVNGQTMGSAGGAQNRTLIQSGLPNVTINIPAGQGSHIHNINLYRPGGAGSQPVTNDNGTFFTTNTGAIVAATLPAMNTASMNGGVTQTPTTTVQPSIVSFLPLIKT